MPTFALPPKPIAAVVATDNRIAYARRLFYREVTNGPDTLALRRSLVGIRIHQEQRSMRYVEPTPAAGDVDPVLNPVRSRTRRTVQVVFNHRGRGRPAPLTPDAD